MPETKEFDQTLRALVRSAGDRNDHWIGMWETGSFGKHVLGSWKWVDGSRLAPYDYQGWNPGEPNYDGSQKTMCVQYHFSYAGYTGNPMWDDDNCSDNKLYICQSRSA
ncbi:CD209 [Branchiostoma lanceolatum]|uniref:CD209 protein n=1 Tax=Branchiostoma lanceolatum TaxID=7740 RepID=A0A8K0EY13_BRALA|nr:CD209 [Branchiostoma lanceolatum]